MNDNEIVYQETFRDSNVLNDAQSIQILLDRLNEIYKEDLGWSIGSPNITPNSMAKPLQ